MIQELFIHSVDPRVCHCNRCHCKRGACPVSSRLFHVTLVMVMRVDSIHPDVLGGVGGGVSLPMAGLPPRTAETARVPLHSGLPTVAGDHGGCTGWFIWWRTGIKLRGKSQYTGLGKRVGPRLRESPLVARFTQGPLFCPALYVKPG